METSHSLTVRGSFSAGIIEIASISHSVVAKSRAYFEPKKFQQAFLLVGQHLSSLVDRNMQ